MVDPVLLVDDEYTFRETVASFLREEGIPVATASNGVKAIHSIAEHKHPLAIIDVSMPGMDGIALLSEIRKISPDTKVIIITAGGTEHIQAEANRLGACDYLNKPIQFPDILNKIKQHLPADYYVAEKFQNCNVKINSSQTQDSDNLRQATKDFEREYISNVLKKCNYDKTATARILGVGLSSLYRKIEELEIDA